MSRFLQLATILSLAACEHGSPATTLPAPQAAPPPAPTAVKVAPATSTEAPPPAVTEDEQPAPCRMTRAGTCWGEKPKARVVKKPAPTPSPTPEPAPVTEP